MKAFGPGFKPLYDTGMGPSSGMGGGLGLGNQACSSTVHYRLMPEWKYREQYSLDSFRR
jgi:hypothetical protein